MFSKACEYGIKSAIYIAGESLEGRRPSLRAIAQAGESPEAFTAKILQVMVKADLMESLKGPTGGFHIDPERVYEITLGEIVSAIDGDDIYKGCGLGLKQCNEDQPCPVHDQFKVVRDELRAMLERTTLFDLTESVGKGLTFLKR